MYTNNLSHILVYTCVADVEFELNIKVPKIELTE